MRQAEFERRHAELWARFEAWLVARAARPSRRGKPSTPPPTPVTAPLAAADVPAAYRALCNHLALARERRYGPTLVERLHQLVLRGHHALYAAAAPAQQGLGHFLTAGFPALVRRERRALGLACLLFFGPLLGLLAAIQIWPDFAAVVIPPEQLAQLQRMYSPDNPHLGRREAAGSFEMFAFYVWNNVRIGFQTFAGGALLGLGSVFFLLFNGVFIGAVLGHLSQVGLGTQIWSFVAGHSALELGAIVISGGAGMKLGGALLMPGPRSRRSALVAEGRVAFRLVGGAALMFLAAAVVEGFWSPLTLDPPLKYGVGALLSLLVLAYFCLAGRAAAPSAEAPRAAR